MSGQPPPYGQQPFGQPPVYGPPPTPPRRPGTVLASCIMAYAAGGLFVVLMLGAIVAVLVNDSFAQGVAQAGQFGSLDEARPRAIGFFSYGLVINAAVVVLAYFVQRGVNGTRIALTVLGGFMVASSLARGPVGVIALVYVGLAVMFLWINGANPWFRAQKIARTTVRPVVPPAPR